MNHPQTEKLISLITAQVLERLRGMSAPVAGVSNTLASKATASNTPANAIAKNSTDWTITQRVVTLNVLQEKPAGATVLNVPPKAVVTPAVRDELRRLGVQLNFREVGQATTCKLSIAVEPALKGMLAAIAPTGATAAIVEEDVDAALQQISAAMTSGGRGLFLTSRPLLVVCRANRDERFRAFAANSEQDVDDANTQIDANLIVLDPVKQNPFIARRILQRFITQNN